MTKRALKKRPEEVSEEERAHYRWVWSEIERMCAEEEDESIGTNITAAESRGGAESRAEVPTIAIDEKGGCSGTADS